MTGRLRRLRTQLDALGADGAWDEAIDLVLQFRDERADDLIDLAAAFPPSSNDADDAIDPDAEPATDNASTPTDDGFRRYAPVRVVAGMLLSALPPEGLAAYRRRIDRAAERAVRAATERRERGDLESLAIEYAGAPAAVNAGLAAAELAIERADYAAARRALARVHPSIVDPEGRAAWATLALLDPAAPAAGVADAWQATSRPADHSRSEASDEVLGPAFARLVVASLQAGDARRAAAELRLLRGLRPDAEARLAGRDGPIVDRLAQLTAAAEPPRSRPAATTELDGLRWAWRKPTSLSRVSDRDEALRSAVFINGVPLQQRRLGMPRVAPTAPAVIDGVAYVALGQRLWRLRLADGDFSPGPEPPGQTTTKDATRDQLARRQAAAERRVLPANGALRFNGVRVFGGRRASAFQRSVHPRLTTAGDTLYAVMSDPDPAAARGRPLAGTPQALVGFDTTQQDKLVLRVAADDSAANAATPGGDRLFLGAPTVRGRRLFAALARRSGQPNLTAACYDARMGGLVWQTPLGSAAEPGWNAASATVAPLVAGDAVYVATGVGAVFALDASSGFVRWATCYPRTSPPRGRVAGLAVFRQAQMAAASAAECFLADDVLVVSTSGGGATLALDAASGRPIWSNRTRIEDGRVLGVARNESGDATLVVAGDRVAGYDLVSGSRRYLWPESSRVGIRGSGAACLVEGRVLWPAGDALYTLDAHTGAIADEPFDLASQGLADASVFPAAGGLLVMSAERVNWLAPTDWRPPGEPAGNSPDAAEEPPTDVTRRSDTRGLTAR